MQKKVDPSLETRSIAGVLISVNDILQNSQFIAFCKERNLKPGIRQAQDCLWGNGRYEKSDIVFNIVAPHLAQKFFPCYVSGVQINACDIYTAGPFLERAKKVGVDGSRYSVEQLIECVRCVEGQPPYEGLIGVIVKSKGKPPKKPGRAA